VSSSSLRKNSTFCREEIWEEKDFSRKESEDCRCLIHSASCHFEILKRRTEIWIVRRYWILMKIETEKKAESWDYTIERMNGRTEKIWTVMIEMH
jgi:hypothetical protein